MNIQFKKGVLELCVLSLLSEGDRYGYELAEAFSHSIDISDGTIYPILRRLNLDGYVTTYLKESTEGPPRKYYALTKSGRQFKLNLVQEWLSFVSEVNILIGENGNNKTQDEVKFDEEDIKSKAKGFVVDIKGGGDFNE